MIRPSISLFKQSRLVVDHGQHPTAHAEEWSRLDSLLHDHAVVGIQQWRSLQLLQLHLYLHYGCASYAGASAAYCRSQSGKHGSRTERYKLRVGQSLKEVVAIPYAAAEGKWSRGVVCVLL